MRAQGALPLGRVRPAPRRATVLVEAKGVKSSAISVQRIMGEGSFGQVFEGSLTTGKGDQKIVLKRVKARVEGAAQMMDMELRLNRYARAQCKGHCADFIGFCEVPAEEANAKLTAGLWLLWRYEGSKTLSYYLKRRDTLRALATDLGVPEQAAVATVVKQLMESLQAFHAAGLVHRDIKPLNIIFSEEARRFKLIDLGACVDLRSGTNYKPDESILDPMYCPPEQYVLPTDSPDLAKNVLSLAISPVLWAKHKPDRFDTWSAGIVMMQLAMPSLRTDRGLRQFNTSFGSKHNYDLQAWRDARYVPERDWELLDADGGAGFQLVQQLLQPRSIKKEDDGGVIFKDQAFPRVAAADALRHRFFKQAREVGSTEERVAARPRSTSPSPAMASSSGRSGSSGRGSSPVASRSGSGKGSGEGAAPKSGAFASAVGLWRGLSNKLFDLEAKILVQASATEAQTTQVKKLRKQVAVGAAPAESLTKAEKKLGQMENRLVTLQRDFQDTAKNANGFMRLLGFGKSSSQGERAQTASKKPSGSSSNNAVLAAAQAARDKRTADAQQRAKEKAEAEEKSRRERQAKQQERDKIAAGAAARAKLDQQDRQAGKKGEAMSIWEQLSMQLAKLEDKLAQQSTATERQSLTVKKLKKEVQEGRADPELLGRAEKTLSRMEKRLIELDREKVEMQNTAGNLLGALGNAFTPNSGGSKQREMPPVPVQQPGLFASLFSSGGSSSRTPTPSTPSASSSANSQGSGSWNIGIGNLFGGGKPKSSSSSVSSMSSFDAADVANDPDKLVSEAERLVNKSISFTGMAAKLALSMANSMTAGAERMIKEFEAAEEAKRQQRQLDDAFIGMLKEQRPPVVSTTTYNEVEALCDGDYRFLDVEPTRRRVLLAAYLAGLAKAERELRQQAETLLRDALKDAGVSEASVFEDVCPTLPRAVLDALPDEQAQRRVLQEVVDSLRAARERREREEAERAERREREEAERSEREAVEARLKEDREVREREKNERDERERAALAALAAARARAAAEADVERAMELERQQLQTDGGGVQAQAADAPDAKMLDALRAEQARLRDEYERMEAKLKQMEVNLKQKEAQAAQELAALQALQKKEQEMMLQHSAADGAIAFELDDQGNVVFHFSDKAQPVLTRSGSNGTSK